MQGKNSGKSPEVCYNDLVRKSDEYDFEPAGPGEVYVVLRRNNTVFGIGPMPQNDLIDDFRLFKAWGFLPYVVDDAQARKIYIDMILERESTNA